MSRPLSARTSNRCFYGEVATKCRFTRRQAAARFDVSGEIAQAEQEATAVAHRRELACLGALVDRRDRHPQAHRGILDPDEPLTALARHRPELGEDRRELLAERLANGRADLVGERTATHGAPAMLRYVVL